CADDAESDVEPKALAFSVNDFGSNEAGNQAEYDPADDTHRNPPSMALASRRCGSGAEHRELRFYEVDRWFQHLADRRNRQHLIEQLIECRHQGTYDPGKQLALLRCHSSD